MRKADDEAKGKESAIEQSLWKTPPSSTLGNGLPHRTELIHDHIAPRSPESSRLQRLPDELLLMIISYLSHGDSEGGLVFFALQQVSRRIISQPTSAASGALEVMKIVRIPQEIRGGWQLAMPNGVCIGRQGHIRLCSHKTLTYDDIKGRIDGGQHGEDRIFLGSCDHEDHSRPCVEGQGPQAFATKLPGGMTVILIFWRGHSGGDPSVFHPSGYLYKTKLKDAVQNIRLQGGRHMTPQRGLNAMAEWDSIMEIDGSESISPDLIKLRGGWASEDPGRPHACSPFRTLKVACGHCEKERGCIVMTYLRRICFDMPEINGGGLPHDWFHALDTASYEYSGHRGVPETCHHTSCRYHYGEGMVTSYPLVNMARP
ncbi:uncharacterized protein FPRN_06773 [Fusarium proliferatum]|nr:uncharacterized protein FPRN_06773 [Fusarium proliferatum]